ncbi:hypothetical protein BXO88_06515 [Oribacterium sp. C9]|uniref:phosphoribosylanthranilate isomerase n=1 Tax=Oribacterium sp. C9 TaxID=1943579 RepID=UPI00098F8CBB|nr:phosphoribosylanthranilate isomerase [Oribacterium sp. C9]OON86644.1 hypothetical protein BXO88_06515 [Oribacterium sp. C9]
MTKVKICGLRRQEDIEAVNRLKPEYIGFVFYEKSRRNVTEDEAMVLRKALDPDIISVGVFVDAEPELILRLMRKGIISIAQLHGHESEEYIEKLKRKAVSDESDSESGGCESTIGRGCSIMKAYLVKSEQDLAAARETNADYILFDNGLGSGESFDWNILRDFPKPYFLAGGLSDANVSDAIQRLSPYAVDISSGVETDGFKDPDKIKSFIDAVRRKNYV